MKKLFALGFVMVGTLALFSFSPANVDSSISLVDLEENNVLEMKARKHFTESVKTHPDKFVRSRKVWTLTPSIVGNATSILDSY